MDIQKKLKDSVDFKNMSGSRKMIKGILGVVIVLILGTLGLELTNNDFDLGALMSGEGFAGSKVIRDADGNINFDGVSPIVANCEAEKYNCSDFLYQAQAQDVMERCGGEGDDIHNLDGDNDGMACEDLPKGE